jgi:hypothetical protein
MRLRMVLVGESQLGVGGAVGPGADVGADARSVGLEGEDGQVAHDLHVLTALVALGYLHLDGRRIGGVALEEATPFFSRAASCWRASMAAMRRSTERTLSRYSSSFC